MVVIKIVDVPEGEAPEWVRKAWVVLTILWLFFYVWQEPHESCAFDSSCQLSLMLRAKPGFFSGFDFSGSRKKAACC